MNSPTISVKIQNAGEKYRLFYTEAIMPRSEIPSIGRIKAIFEDISLDEFLELINTILERNDHKAFNLFLYYILLFRDMKNMQAYVNSEKFSIEMLEKLMLFTHGYCTFHEYSLERILDELLYFIDSKRLLDLLLNSEHISKDKLFLFYILSKFDTDMLDLFFKKIRNVSEFIDFFLRLPEDIMRSIITRNYKLFQYIMLLMAENDYNKMYTETFFNKYREDIDQFSMLSDVIRKYKKNTDLSEERKLPVDKRNMARISFIVNRIREMQNADKAIEYFDSEGIFADEEEKQVIVAIVGNPLFRNVFRHYDNMFEV